MVKIIQITEAYEGGVRRHLRDLALGLEPACYEQHLVLSFRRNPCGRADPSTCAERGIPVHSLPMARSFSLFRDLAAFFRLLRLVRRLNPDLLHAHSSKAGVLARLAGLVCRIPVIYTPHCFAFRMRHPAWSLRLYRLIEHSLVGATLRLIAVSEEEQRSALELGYSAGQVALIRNGVVTTSLPEVVTRETMAPRIGFFGRLSRQKGADLLLAAMPEVLRALPGTTVTLHGSGRMEHHLRQLAHTLGVLANTRFNGAYQPDETLRLMRQVDVIAIPSRWEASPYVLLEAFQSGVPVVATRVGGVVELVEHGVSGLLVEPDDHHALGAAILRLAREPALRRRLAVGARVALATCSLEGMVARHSALYTSCRVGAGS